MRPVKSLHLTVVAFIAAAALLGAILAASAAAHSPKQPHVVCFGTHTWRERVLPHTCNLHVKNDQMYYVLRDLHWTSWHRSLARGRGRWRISDARLRIHIALSNPRWGWGPNGVQRRYFSWARIAGPHVAAYGFRLDVPQHSRVYHHRHAG
jgi:hypothetical protein